MKGPWKVGELAKITAVTVRTLHHYDQIGLLRPSSATDGGHRLYTTKDLVRLQQILSMKSLGFSLEQTKTALDSADSQWSPLQVLQAHMQQVKEQLSLQQELLKRLEAVARILSMAENLEVSAEQFIAAIGGIAMFDKYYSKEQLKDLEERRKQIGEERIKEIEAEWPKLMAEVKNHMDQGTSPKSQEVQDLAKRWMELVHEFTGGNKGIETSLNNMYQNESQVAGMDTGEMRKMMQFIQEALK